MAVLQQAVLWGPLPFSRWGTNNFHYKIKIKPNSILLFSSNLPLSHTKKIRVFARFGRPTNRRNSLREKLTQHQPRQLNEVTSNPNSPTDYDNTDNNCSNLDKDNVEDIKSESNYRVSDEIEINDSSVNVLKKESLGDLDLKSKLERWADQYKADSEFWGIGFNPIFTIFQNKEGKIKRVVVNKEEILKRNGIELDVYTKKRFDVEFFEVNSKISHAKFLAREMESGNYEIPKSRSLAKIISLEKNLGFFESIRDFSIQSNFTMKKVPKSGILVLCGFFVIWAVRALFVDGESKKEYRGLEKEMLRRKIKARKERESLVKGSVEVINDPLEMKLASVKRPRVDKDELLNNITKAKPFGDKLVAQEYLINEDEKNSNEFDSKVMEIRAMAKRAREIERGNSSFRDSDERDEFDFDEQSYEEEGGERDVDRTNGISNNYSARTKDLSEILMPFYSDDLKNEYVASEEETLVDNSDTQTSDLLKTEGLNSGEKIVADAIDPLESVESDPIKTIDTEITDEVSGTDKLNNSFDNLNGQTVKGKRSFEKKPRVITSVNEAKEFLSQKSEKLEPVEEYQNKTISEIGIKLSSESEKETKIDLEKGNGVIDKTISGESDIGSKTPPSANNENWMENNFETLEPVLKKIGGGFRENYAVAREKIKQELDITPPMNFPEFEDDDDEMDWMKDDKLREIVFQVRDNELTGRDPFYLMDEEDKITFLEGLEKKVDKENEKLSKLHQYLHSNIENLDYGADGMSVYDPPEKIIPRWKGPPINQNNNPNPEFLENFEAQKRTLVNGTSSGPDLNKIRESPSNEKILPKSNLNDQNKKSLKTVIEGSDGSLRAGKKSGKEFWEHTKKWSQGFLDSYNNETDPEIKAVMKDMGKDLDRWITPKEIQEADDLINELPQNKKEFMEKKLSKVRREMELFGPQAVLSKYKEYGDRKEEDYLWWLDLPFVLCIELYTVDNGEERIGLYSLEMAEDLELDPKPIHVIAFEEANDCKNLCYIIQAHLEMLGNGNAFVVARPPKDAFREAKANGFSVSVIRKGELKLNIDQTLEEVEEEIKEIGTKIYHDKIMGDQSVDMSALMKGVYGARKPSKRRRSMQKLKRPTHESI